MMAVWLFLRAYWKPILLSLLLAGFGWKCWQIGKHGAEFRCLQARAEEVAAYERALEAERNRANVIDQQLQDALNAPKVAPVIRRVISANPANCNLPKPVADSLRDSIDAANARIGSR